MSFGLLLFLGGLGLVHKFSRHGAFTQKFLSGITRDLRGLLVGMLERSLVKKSDRKDDTGGKVGLKASLICKTCRVVQNLTSDGS